MSQINSYADSDKFSLCIYLRGLAVLLPPWADAWLKSGGGGHLPMRLNI